MGLLSGISNLGLGKLEEADIYGEKEKEKKAQEAETAKEEVFNEADVLFDKTCNCPVCDASFSYRALKSGKIKLVSQDPDLRPKYDKMDPLKYDAVVCPKCGYAALTRYLAPLPSAQVKLVKEGIAGKVRGITSKSILSYDDAIQRYQLALASAIVKKAKDSEKAYICLRMAWVIRSKKEELPLETEGYDDIIASLRADENEALQTAFEGFINARQKESFPIAGMDEITVDYLLAVLSARFGHYDIAQKMVGSILTNKAANNRIKDRARDLKEQILMEIKMQKESNA